MTYVPTNVNPKFQKIGTFTDRWPYLFKHGHWYASISGLIIFVFGYLGYRHNTNSIIAFLLMSIGALSLIGIIHRLVFGFQPPHLFLTNEAVVIHRRRKFKKILKYDEIKQIIIWNPPRNTAQTVLQIAQLPQNISLSNTILLLARSFDELSDSVQKSLINSPIVLTKDLKFLPTRFYSEPALDIAKEIASAAAQQNGSTMIVCQMMSRGPEPIITAEEINEAKSTGYVPRGTFCRRCDYDLRGQKVEEVCPECEYPNVDSMKDHALSLNNAAWLNTLKLGLSMAVVASLLIGLTLALSLARILWDTLPLRSMPSSLWISLAVFLFGIFMLTIATFQVTATESGAYVSRGTARMYRFARLGWLFPPLVLVCLFAFGATGKILISMTLVSCLMPAGQLQSCVAELLAQMRMTMWSNIAAFEGIFIRLIALLALSMISFPFIAARIGPSGLVTHFIGTSGSPLPASMPVTTPTTTNRANPIALSNYSKILTRITLPLVMFLIGFVYALPMIKLLEGIQTNTPNKSQFSNVP